MLDAAGTPIPSVRDLAASVFIYAPKNVPPLAANAATVCDPSGNVDQAALISRTISQLPDGATLVFPPGTYRLHADITNVDAVTGKPKSIHLSGYGATLRRTTTAASGIILRGAYDPVQTVVGDALAAIEVYTESLQPGTHDPMRGVQFTIAAGLDWVRGDVIKLVADDALPDSRENAQANPTASSARDRAGQFLKVYSYDPATGICKAFGVLRDSFTTGIRVARMQTVTGSVSGFTFETSAGVMTNVEGAGNSVSFRSLMAPVLRDNHLKQNNGPGVQFVDCYGYLAENNEIRHKLNDGSKHFGYGITDASSYAGVVTGNNIGEVRHGFTTVQQAIEPGGSFYKYGRSFGTKVINNTIESCTSSGIDTHLGAMHVQAYNNTIVGSRGGISLRGLFHDVGGNTIRDCDFGVSINNEAASDPSGLGRRSYGTTVHDNLLVNVKVAFKVSLNMQGSTSGPDFNPADHTRETVRSFIRNNRAFGISKRAFEFDNATVQMDDNIIRTVSGALDVSDDTAFFVQARRSLVTGNGNRVETTGSSFTGGRLFDLAYSATPDAYASTLQLADTRVALKDATQLRELLRVTTSTTVAPASLVQVDGLVLDFGWSANSQFPYPAPGLSGASWFDFEVINSTSRRSDVITMPPSGVADPFYINRIKWTRKPTVLLEIGTGSGSAAITADFTLAAALPIPAIPNRLVIRVDSGINVTVGGQAQNLRPLAGSGTTLILPAGKIAEFIGSPSKSQWAQMI